VYLAPLRGRRLPRAVPKFLAALLALTLLLALLPLGASSRALAAPAINAERRTLANGLTVILEEDHSAPVVAIQVWVRAGSRYETPGEAGMTHLIEHMIFKGTERRGPGELAKAIESSGGEINAYTSFDQTVYHTELASRYLPLGLDVLSDAVCHSRFDPQELEREKLVVIEEIRQRDDQPTARLSKAMFAAAYHAHPYGRPVIGSEKSVASFSRGDVMAYLAKWYWPGNMTLVVTGDLDPAKAWPLIEQSFGQASYPGRNGSAAKPTIAAEPAQAATRVVALGADVNEAYLDVAFHIPDVAHDDSYALDVLSEVLGEGASSRLYREVKQDKGLVHSVDASAFTPLDPGLFFVSAALDPGKVPQALPALLTEAFRLRGAGPTAAEMAKARLNIEAAFVRSRATVEGQAGQLGYFQCIRGDYQLERDYLTRIGTVTPEDVRRVAERYLTPANMTAALLTPAGREGAFTPELVSDAATKALAAAKPAPQAQAKAPAKTPVAVRWVLPNGMRVVVKERPGSGTVAVQAAVLGGLRYEEPRQAGVASFASAMLTKGAAGKSAVQIAAAVDSMAAGLSGFSGRNSMGLSGDFLAERLDEGLGLFADVLRRPSFAGPEVEKMRANVLAAIKSRQDELSAVAIDLFNQGLYGPHPYGRALLGTPKSVAALKPNDLAAFWGRYVKPNGLVLTVVGDVTADHVRHKVEELFGDWRGRPGKPPVIPAERPPQKVTRLTKAKDGRNQIHLLVGFPGARLTDPDRYALDVLDAALSSQGGRLFIHLRDELSLAYMVSCFSQEGIEPGSFAVYIATSAEKRDRALAEMLGELKRACQGISDKELERAKSFVVGNYEIGLQSNSAQASEMGLDELYGLGYDYSRRYVAGIEKVSRDDVLAAAKKYVRLERYLLAEVGAMVGPKVGTTGAVAPQGAAAAGSAAK